MELESSLPHSQVLATSLWMIRTMIRSYGEELLAPCPTPKLEDHILVGCPRLLIQYMRSYCPYWRPFLHPQPEGEPCRGERDSRITDSGINIFANLLMEIKNVADNLKKV
jgi:hypothetical protein